MLHLKGLHLRQGDFTLTADWALQPGARLALIGPSGAGKSTLLAALGGFLVPEAGQILWKGQDITALPPGLRPVTTLFQDQNLFPHLTIAQNLGLGIAPNLRLSAADNRRVEEALERTGLSGMGPRKPARLSGGQQSRAALARALLRARPVLMLDEPFAALGPALKAEMLSLVDELSADTDATVLMVTHDPDDALALCPLACLVADGRAEAPTRTADLLANPPEALIAYLG